MARSAPVLPVHVAVHHPLLVGEFLEQIRHPPRTRSQTRWHLRDRNLDCVNHRNGVRSDGIRTPGEIGGALSSTLYEMAHYQVNKTQQKAVAEEASS